MRQPGFFDIDERYAALDAMGDPLVVLNRAIPWEKYYPDTDFLIILLDDLPVGRLYLARWPSEIRIVDLALLPAHRNAGIGTRILQDIACI